MKRRFILILIFFCYGEVKSEIGTSRNSGRPLLIDKLFRGCKDAKSSIACFSDRAARTIERSMNIDIPIFDGLTFVRNQEPVNFRRPKSMSTFQRLSAAVSNFLKTHTFSFDLTQARSLDKPEDKLAKAGSSGGGGGSKGGGGGGDNGGFFNMNSKDVQREKKYYQYAFMVLLGIFGLTGPLVMKILGIMAAKALLAAKAALIIVGSVALKKLFEKSHQKPKVKVTTLPVYETEEDHEHDRYGFAFNHIPYAYSASQAYKTDSNPYSAYYSGSSNNIDTEFAPILYGTHYNKVKNSKTR